MCWLLKYKFTPKTYNTNKQASTETSKWHLWTTELTLVQLTRFLTWRMSWQRKWCSTMMHKETGEGIQLYNDDMVSSQITVVEVAVDNLWPLSNLFLFTYCAVIPANPNQVILHQLNHHYCIKKAKSHTTQGTDTPLLKQVSTNVNPTSWKTHENKLK